MSAPRVELRSLQVFLVLAEELHFARTGERVGLTPSRVSQIVRELEEHVGGALFARTSRRVSLTALGQRLLEDLEPGYRTIERALTTAREQTSGVVGELRIGSYHLMNFGVGFFAASRAFEAAHPRATVSTIDLGMQRNPLTALRAGEVDAVASRLPASDADLIVGPVLTSEERILVVATDHPLAGRDSVSYEEVGDYTCNDPPAMPRELMDAFIPPRTPSGRLVPRVRSDSWFDTVALIAAGRIVHPTVSAFLEYIGHPGVTGVPIDDLPPSRTALVWLADRPPPGVLALARILEDLVTPAR